MQRNLGAVQIGEHDVGLLIAYSGDAAILNLSVAEGKYIPLFASTYRGVPSVDIDIYASKAMDEVWVYTSWQDQQVLAYHRFGTQDAITSFGKLDLLDTPFPMTLSGGPVPFPERVADTTVKIASFYHHEATD